MIMKLPNTDKNSKQALTLIFDPAWHCLVLNYGFYSNEFFKNSFDYSLCIKVMRWSQKL